MSKSFGLPGLRTGWLSTRNKSLLKKAEIFKAYTTVCNSALSELVSIKALKKKDQILKRNLGIVKSNLSLLDEFFDRHKDKFVWRRPKAGPIAFVEIRGNTNIDGMAQDLVERTGILIVPSSLFDYGTRHFRIGLGRKNMPEVLKLFEEYVNCKF
jgi:aspartate/methionine/tyrosine aminotransferase